jgi:hypothetical protein
MKLAAVITLTFSSLFAAAAWANDIKYQVLGYGQNHALVILNGELGPGLITNMSADGLSVRISGVNASYIPQNKAPLPSLIAGIQQVRRGSYTDLVLTLTTASNLSASPAGATMRLFIQARREGAASSTAPSAEEIASGPDSLPKTAVQFPLKIVIGPEETPPKAAGVTVVFPGSYGLKSTTGFSAILRLTAYASDLLWSWLSQQELSFAPEASAGCQDPAKDRQIAELQALLKDLTDELMRVRGIQDKTPSNSTKDGSSK